MSDWLADLSLEDLRYKVRGCMSELYDIECILGDALGYGRIPDDGPAPGQPNIGDHTAASLSLEAAGALRELGYVRSRPDFG